MKEPIKQFKLPKILIWLINQSIFLGGKPKNTNLLDGNKTNTIYKSKRSNMKYIYVSNLIALLINKLVKIYLKHKTGISFNNEINKICLPINMYVKNDSITEHRDRNMFKENEFIDYIAVITLHQKGIKSNFGVKENVVSSPDGKVILNTKNTVFHTLNTYLGQVIIVRNYDTSHAFFCDSDERVSLTYRT